MLDIKLIRERPELFRDAYKFMKKPDLLKKLDDLIDKDARLRKLKTELDELRSSRNKLSQEVNQLKKEGKDISKVLKRVKALPEEIKKAEEVFDTLEKSVIDSLCTLPNLMHDTICYGESDKDNVELKKWGNIKKFSFPVKNHVEILENLGLVDFEASAKVSGNGFYYLKGDLALLNQALIRFVIEFMNKKKYVYLEPPLLLWKEIILAGGDAKAFEQSIYTTEEDKMALIGTSEFAILAYHKGEVLKEAELPKKYFSYTMCFRKEIGAHGINEKGLWRTHQFNKVEQFIFCKKEDSGKLYEELLNNSEEIFQALELHYRVIELCTGDMATWKHRSGDIEVWRPTTQDYGEVTSVSNCTDYQARKLGIRYDTKKGREVVHTLNNTAIATSRALVAIIENNQQKDGTVKIPKVLLPYMFGKTQLG